MDNRQIIRRRGERRAFCPLSLGTYERSTAMLPGYEQNICSSGFICGYERSTAALSASGKRFATIDDYKSRITIDAP